ncbi:MAG: thiamine diphosphokinase [Gammaproteobacteria bacterium]|nr:thiamine diphosphokinase [Gammaproteobacteria bacterium]
MYDALIVVNGEIPHPKFWKDIPYRTLICTDGAAKSLSDFAIMPDIIIGDMDSISVGTHFSTVEAIQKHFPLSKVLIISEQLSTDFEKALNFAKENNLHNVICLGALGKSADHSIHNLSMLNRYKKVMNLMLMHTFEQSRQWVFLLQENTCITTQKGETLSLFSFENATLSTKGLKWELENTTISHSGQTAIRNMTVDEKIEIKCIGNCLCFLTSDTPPILTNSPD